MEVWFNAGWTKEREISVFTLAFTNCNLDIALRQKSGPCAVICLFLVLSWRLSRDAISIGASACKQKVNE